MTQNRIWLAFASGKRCRHADAIHALGFINWRMGKNIRFDVGDIVYLFMSDERKVRFKMRVTAKNCKREDSDFWIEKAPDDITYKLDLLGEIKVMYSMSLSSLDMASKEDDHFKYPIAITRLLSVNRIHILIIAILRTFNFTSCEFAINDTF